MGLAPGFYLSHVLWKIFTDCLLVVVAEITHLTHAELSCRMSTCPPLPLVVTLVLGALESEGQLWPL